MSEVAPAGGGPNRMFIVIALGLVGLLIIGVVVVVGILFFQSQSRPAPAAVGTPTRAATIVLATTPTRAALVVFTPTVSATDTPLPTATLVVQPQAGGTTPVGSGAAASTATVTGTVAAGTGTPGTGLPQTGLGEDLLMLAGGIVLVFVIFAARRARTTAAA